MPAAGIGTFTMSPAQAEAAVFCALENGCRMIERHRLI
jgi:diketogulonate reductase-like aldo/keto reductase